MAESARAQVRALQGELAALYRELPPGEAEASVVALSWAAAVSGGADAQPSGEEGSPPPGLESIRDAQEPSPVEDAVASRDDTSMAAWRSAAPPGSTRATILEGMVALMAAERGIPRDLVWHRCGCYIETQAAKLQWRIIEEAKQSEAAEVASIAPRVAGGSGPQSRSGLLPGWVAKQQAKAEEERARTKRARNAPGLSSGASAAEVAG